MRRLFVILLMIVCTHLTGWSQRVTHNFEDTPITQVLKWLSQQTKVYTINFLYNELEDFMVTTSFKDLSVEEAIRQAIGFYPIQMRVDEEHRLITVECQQPSAKRYMGTVVDAQGQALEYANVAILRQQDSTFITGGITHSNGRFVIPCKQEPILLKVSHIGYATRTMPCTAGQVGTIELQSSTSMMAALTIAGRIYEDHENGYTIHPSEKGMQATDMLTSLPHLSLRDNHYHIDGQEVKTIYVDGQPINTLGELCYLSSEMVSQVKVDYLSRTIHITLRKPKPSGFYGSLDGNARFLREEGYYDRSFGGVWYSRHGGLSIYDRYGAETYDATERYNQSTYSTNNVTMSEGYISPLRTRISNRLSLTHQFNERHSLGASYYVASNKMTAYSNTFDWDNATKPQTYYEGHNQYTDHEGTLRYNASLGRRNIGLHLIADFYSRETQMKDLSLYGAGVGTESGESPSITMERYSAEVNVPIHPRWDGKLGMDVRGFSSMFDPSRFVSNFKGAKTLTYQLKVDGWMPQAYAEVQGKWRRLQVSAGGMMQMNVTTYQSHDPAYKKSQIEGDVQTEDYNQFSVSPRVRLSLPFGKENRHQVALSYQHELEPIPYSVMSPFIRWSDAFNYSVGNPNLKAPDFHLITLSASLWNNALNLSVAYRRERNEIYWQSFASQGQQEIFYTRPTNLSATQMLTLHAETRIRPTPQWQLKAAATLDLRPENQTMQGVRYNQLHWRHDYLIRNDLHFEKGWTATISFHLQPTYHIYDRTYYTQYQLGGEVGKSFCSNRWHCTLEFNALGNRLHLERQIGNISTTFKQTSPTQMAGIRLTWNFKGGKKVKVGTTEGEQEYREISDR